MTKLGEFFRLRFSLDQARGEVLSASVRAEIASQLARAGAPRKPTKLLITSSEINDRHGTGVLMGRLFDPSDVFSLISRRDHRIDGIYSHLRMADPLLDEGRAKEMLGTILREMAIDQVLVVPHFVDEVRTALLLRELSQIPLATWMMDDPSLGETRIPKTELERLFAISSLCFAISPLLAKAYKREFMREFAVLPPTVSQQEVHALAVVEKKWEHSPHFTACMLGNVWNPQWLQDLRRMLPATGWKIDWFGHSADWRKDASRGEVCVVPQGFLPEEKLRSTLSQYPFAVLATGTADEADAMRTLSLWSLPSRLVFLFAACQIPLLVVGGEDSCAARIVRKFQIGTTCPYDSQAFHEAAGQLTNCDFNQRCRIHCRQVGEKFLSDGLADWVWESVRRGHPITKRFEFLEMESLP